MKKIRKLMVLLLALSMIMSGFVISFAEEANSEAEAVTVETTEPSAETAEEVSQPEIPAADIQKEAVSVVNEEPAEDVVEVLKKTPLAGLAKPSNILSKSKIASNAALGINGTVDSRLRKAGYRSFLIMGIDGGRRSDIMIVLVLKKKGDRYDGKIFTVARDTYMHLVDVKKRPYSRVNQGYASGGLQVAMKTLNRNLDLNIKEGIAVNWQCAADMITAITPNKRINGNITNSSMLSEINTKIKAANKREGKSTPQVKVKQYKKNNTPLLGWQAVEYLRARKYNGGSTWVREARNRAMFNSIFFLAKKKNLNQRKAIMYKLANTLDTNMGEDSLALVGKINSIKDAGGFPYSSTTLFDPLGKHYVRVPSSLVSNVKTLHKNMYPGVSYSPSKTVKSISASLAARSKKFLKKNGSLAAASVSLPAKAYNGKAQAPAPVVKLSGVTLKQGSDYSVTNVKRTDVGAVTVKITGKGEFTGTRTATFKINPLGTKINKLTPKSKAITVSWIPQVKKMAKYHIKGYQIQYSTSKNFKTGAKIATVNGCSKGVGTLKNLKAKKWYFVRIRTYMKVGKVTCYSVWSTPIAAKTK